MSGTNKTFEKPNCPECDEPAFYIVETVEISTPIQEKKDGSFFYSGDDTETHFDTSKPKVDENGMVELGCESEHYWVTRQFHPIKQDED